jgi:hypothetical protein
MPYISQWVPADEFLEYCDVTIYHTYRGNEYEAGENLYFYSTVIDSDEDSRIEHTFDVRTLPNWTESNCTNEYQELKHIKEIIKEAIRIGHIVVPQTEPA